MRPLELIRQKAYWLLDAAKGSPVHRQLEEIRTHFSPAAERDREIASKSANDLTRILNYATDHVDFYKTFSNWQRLEDFPVINKIIVRENESSFLSPEYDLSSLTIRETSGSTGMPFTVYQDPSKRIRATADTLYFSQQANYKLGTRLYFSRVWDKKTTRSKWQCLKQNWVMHDASALSDEALQHFLHVLEKDRSTKSVIIFASSLTAIAKYLERYNVLPKVNISSFITISESLDSWTKQTIEKRFCCQVFSRYSDEELGILAQQIPGCDTFLANTASFYFEILDMDKDVPVEDGQLGRIVVTDLFNHAMPLIRYDTGDIAIKKATADGNHILFEIIGGRRVDCIFDTRGGLVSPYVINTPMHAFLEIRQYQFIQEGEKDYQMLLNLEPGISFSRESEMIEMLRSYLGEDASITVSYVSEIPVLKSGKRKQVVNNYRPA